MFTEYAKPLSGRIVFDSHAHYDDEAFDPDRDELLAALPQQGICGVINCGSDLAFERNQPPLSGKLSLHLRRGGRAPA